MKLRLLDLFCGAGGAAVGYHRAGFEVIGVDIEPQRNYPFEFHRDDALELLERGWELVDIDAIHVSPPCQAYSTLGALNGRRYPTLIESVRAAIQATGLPYVIENVQGAPLENPVRLCGSSFGLEVRRHRMFETDFAVMVPECDHANQPQPIDVTGTGMRRTRRRRRPGGGESRKPRSLDEAREAMGIDWMTRRELSEAIPPVYTEHIGKYLLDCIIAERKAA